MKFKNDLNSFSCRLGVLFVGQGGRLNDVEGFLFIYFLLKIFVLFCCCITALNPTFS